MTDGEIKRKIADFQKNEITEYHIYLKLSRSVREQNNREIIKHIAEDELRHYGIWRQHTGKDIPPDYGKMWWYFLIARFLGLTFGIKLMEKGEGNASQGYRAFSAAVPDMVRVAADEERHEKELIGMIDEEGLKYVGSVVLGLNDALVEFTGCLAGFTLALQNNRVIATAGLITGIAASLSMAVSEYFSTESEGTGRSPVKSAIYTGIAYVFTVGFLVFPYLVFANLYLCLSVTLFNAVIIIAVYTYYICVAKDMPFKKRFWGMTLISFGIAALSFLIGLLVRKFLNINI